MDNHLKVAIVYDTWEEAEAPAAAPEPAPRRRATSRQRQRKRDKPDREEIFEALQKLGHEPTYYALDGRDATLLGLAKSDADLFFNLTESYAGDDTRDVHLAAYFDLLGRPYTGAGPHALYLAQDKALAKKIFAFHSIRTPSFAACYKGRLDHAHDVAFPLIVKPASEDGSVGIEASSVVQNVKELMQRIDYIHEAFDSPALIEEYIEGRELYAAILGNGSPEVLPLIELDLSRLPEGTPKIATAEVKWERGTEAYKLTKSAPVEDLPEPVAADLASSALAAYRALKLRDYGRIDLRLTPKNEVYVIEANPNPWLSSGAEFAMAAKKAGRSYSQLIAEILALTQQRTAAQV
ncbi:MAG: D-alanine--D-alanine ligase family protein [Terriglobales bacterium]